MPNHTNMAVETWAIVKGLELCWEAGIRQIWIETDALSVIHLINTPGKGHWTLQHYLSRARKLVKKFDAKITHIFREGNQVADFLANLACNTGENRTLQPQPLSGEITGLIKMDKWNCPNFRFA